jgi:serine/threonine protein kinase
MEGRLSEQEAGPVEEHLLQCADCLERTRNLRSDDTVFEALRVAAPVLTLHSGLKGAPRSAAVEMDAPTATSEDTEELEPEIDLASLLSPPQGPGELGRLGAFRVLRVLGRGGMGVVFEGEDIGLGRRVAIKVITSEYVGHSRAVQRFVREARAAAAIRDPHVVTIHQVAQDGERRFIVQELLTGESLSERLRRENRLPIQDCIEIARQAALGLASAHDRSLLHRDIKPANIWLESPETTQGPQPAGCGGPADHTIRVKLLDFGLARELAGDAELTGNGVLLGTPRYMSPEQGDGSPLDARSDLFSLGVVLYRMLTGVLPFRGNTVIELLRSLANDLPADPRTLREDCPERLARLTMTLLDKRPEHRPAHARDVVRELDAISESVSAAPFRSRLRGAAWGRPPSKRILAALGGLAAAILGGVIVITITDKDGNQQSVTVNTPDDAEKINVTQDGVPLVPGSTPQARPDQEPRPGGSGPSWQPTADQQAFFVRVATLPPEEQVEVVRQELMRVNPGYDGVLQHEIADGQVVALKCVSTAIQAIEDVYPIRALTALRTLDLTGADQLSDLRPLSGLPLQEFHCGGTNVADLRPLSGMPLNDLELGGTPVVDLSPLKALPLRSLYLAYTQVSDLSPLAEMESLRGLSIDATHVRDLTPLKGLNLEVFGAQSTRIDSLAALRGMPLRSLVVNTSSFLDLSPLQGMPLVHLGLGDAVRYSDLSPLHGLPLVDLGVNVRLFHPADEEIIRSLPLQSLYLSDQPFTDAITITSPEEVLRQLDARRQAAETFVETTSQLAPAELLAAVAAELEELNRPHLAGARVQLGHVVEGDDVVEATLVLGNMRDVRPLRALQHLRKLVIVQDINVPTLDISAVNSLPLEEVRCSAEIALRNSPVFRGMPTLKTINGEPAAEYLDSLDAQFVTARK